MSEHKDLIIYMYMYVQIDLCVWTCFYQPAARKVLVLGLLCRFRVCISVRPHLSRAH